MTRDAGDLAASLETATAPQFRRRLLARGQAQSMIRRDGVLPEDAPQFSAYLDDDLLSYSYALISTSMHLLDATDTENDGEGGLEAVAERLQLARNGFVQASYAVEAATRNAVPAEDLAFHRLIAGAASHLGGYAARAFSLMQTSIQSGRLTPMEATLADLVLRNLDGSRTVPVASGTRTTFPTTRYSWPSRHKSPATKPLKTRNRKSNRSSRHPTA